MSLVNYTSHAVDAALLYDARGAPLLVVAVKVSRKLRSPEEAHDDPLLVHKTDVVFPGGALRYPGDMPPAHEGTDIVCHGHVYAPGGRAAYEARAQIVVAGVRAQVIARGARTMERKLVGLAPSSPQPFLKVPLRFENALGGPRSAVNPIGTGDFAHLTPAEQEGKPLPTIEWAGDAPKGPFGSPAPAGFGPIGPGWEPRSRFAGTYDEAWRRTRAPLPPLDFDPRFFIASNVGLWSPAHLRGGEPIELDGLSPEGRIVTTLPRTPLGIRVGDEWQRPELDLVILEPDEDRVSLTYRVAVSMRARLDRMPHIRVVQKRILSAQRGDA